MAKGSDMNFDDMSRDELVNMIGGNVNPDASRDELITMAREKAKRDDQV